MSERLSIAIVSGPLLPGDKNANLSMMEQALSGPTAHTELVLFAEANINGGFWKGGEKEYPDLAETVPDGPSSRRAIAMARQHRKTICCGLLERAEGTQFITHLLCGPDGLLGVQRKIYTNPAGSFTSGSRARPIEFRGQRCLILACADILAPEGPILARLARPSLILAPTDCFYARQEPLVRRLLSVRAMDAGAPVLMAFGHDPDATEPLLAGTIALPNGEFAALECRDSQQVSVVLTNVEPRRSDRGWAFHAKAQAEVLRRNLEEGT